MSNRRKTVKILLFGLLDLIAAAYLFLFFSFNSYKPSPVGYEVVPAALGYFHTTYEDCRSAFVERARRLASLYKGVEVFQVPVAGKGDSDLTIDGCYIPAQKAKENLLVLSSGIHGVEGFLGSAVQSMAMDDVLGPDDLDGTGVLLIHGMNPYGFKHLRRVTENNVDLNRNCAIEESLFETRNEGYGRLRDLLNPRGKADDRSVKDKNIHLVILRKALAGSVSALRQAILQGQYDYPEGISFGGRAPEPQIVAMGPLLRDLTGPYARILTIDLHTGYGENGTMHLFAEPVRDAETKAEMEALFAGYRVDWADSAGFYTVSGSFADYLGSLAPGKKYYAMPLEFGTLDSQKLFGSLKSLHIMMLENQGFQYGYKDEKTEARIKRDFLEMFCPSDPVWRSKAVMDAKRILERVLEGLRDKAEARQ
jgi:hypothetical protein